MKRFFRIFELTKSEQRVVLIIIFTLVAIAFVSYERRAGHHLVETRFTAESKRSPSPVQNEDEP